MVGDFDKERIKRIHLPEIVLSEKPLGVFKKFAEDVISKNELVLFSRVDDKKFRIIQLFARKYKKKIRKYNTLIAVGKKQKEKKTKIGIIAGGLADYPWVEEAKGLLEELGVKVIVEIDKGLAHPERTKKAVERLEKENVKSIIAVAGREGALFTYVAATTKLPVIALPTPVGYGFNAGFSALSSALQSCSPGLVTVNIGDSVNAALAALRIINLLND